MIDGLEDYPAIQVAYASAEAYAASVGKALPSEAEWECAAKGRRADADYAGGRTGTQRGHRHLPGGAVPLHQPVSRREGTSRSSEDQLFLHRTAPGWPPEGGRAFMLQNCLASRFRAVLRQQLVDFLDPEPLRRAPAQPLQTALGP